MSDTYTEAGPADRVSKQRFDMGMRCMYQYFQRYVLGNKRPPLASWIFGGAHDKMANRVYDFKIDTGETPSKQDCRGIFAAEFDQRREEVEDWGKDDPGKLLDLGTNLAQAWHDVSAVNTLPVKTQVEFHFPLTYLTKEDEKKQVDVMGYVDLVEEVRVGLNLPEDRGLRRVITEHKTSGKSFNAGSVQSETQGIVYSLAAEKAPELKDLGVDPNEVHFNIAVKTKTPKIQTAANDPAMIRHLSGEERTGMLKRMAMFHQAIEANLKTGNWLPNRRDMMCSKRQCGYWRSCEKAFGPGVKD